MPHRGAGGPAGGRRCGDAWDVSPQAHSALLSRAVNSAPSDLSALTVPGARKPSLLEALSVCGFFVVSLLVVARLVSMSIGGQALAIGLAVALGYVVSDLVSGLVHWGFDTWGARDTPVLGPTFIVPFRVHHDDPEDITRHGFIATNGHNCLVSLPVLFIALFLPAGWRGSGFVSAFLFALCLGVFGTNQFHKWAHQKAVPGWIAWLQRAHLVLGPEHHAVHHVFPHERHYCITTGWLNRMLDAAGFFRRLERVISAATGARPRSEEVPAEPHLSAPEGSP